MAKTTKKTTASKSSAKSVPSKSGPAGKARSKSEVYGAIADQCGLSRKQVASVFDSMSSLMAKDLSAKGGVFAVPGLMKVTTVHKPATKARKGINPFTGEETMFKAKPASTKVKIRPLRALKDMVS